MGRGDGIKVRSAAHVSGPRSFDPPGGREGKLHVVVRYAMRVIAVPGSRFSGLQNTRQHQKEAKQKRKRIRYSIQQVSPYHVLCILITCRLGTGLR